MDGATANILSTCAALPARHNTFLKAQSSAAYIPESLYAKKVLEIFKRTKNKFGVVVDEYGNIEGIITLHDLTESIFGDILEENETEEQDIVVRQDGSMLVEASMNLDDFMEAMGIMDYDDLKEEDFTTLSGLAMFLIGRVPKAGDLFDYKNLHFEIVDMDRGRVDKLLVTKKKKKTTRNRMTHNPEKGKASNYIEKACGKLSSVNRRLLN